MRYQLVGIECVCGAEVVGHRGETTRRLRDRLEDVGWFTDWRRNYDLCPACLDDNPQHRLAVCPGCGRRFSVVSF